MARWNQRIRQEAREESHAAFERMLQERTPPRTEPTPTLFD